MSRVRVRRRSFGGDQRLDIVGHRRLAGQQVVVQLEVRVIDMPRIVVGENAENEVRKW